MTTALVSVDALADVLATWPRRIVACSGGVDSLLLAAVASQDTSAETVVAHAVTPAVPPAATARVHAAAADHGWDLELVRSHEFEDERYLSNPQDRCFFCKTNLYDELERLAEIRGNGWKLLSGTNTDDLGEYRPGLRAAAEHDAAHPYVEAGMAKADVRALARALDLPWADLPAAPCLASRLYTGTRVTPSRLRAVDVGEETIRHATGIDVVRCRLDGDRVRIEVLDHQRPLIDDALVDRVADVMRAIEPTLQRVELDADPYRAGRAFLPVA